jgi:hypothetical protein
MLEIPQVSKQIRNLWYIAQLVKDEIRQFR